MDTVAVLDAPAVEGTARVARQQSTGRYALAQSSFPLQILILSPDGTVIDSIGRRGQGPGELGRVTALVFDDADSLWVVGRSRLDVWSPELAYVRSVRLKMGARGADPMRGGGVVLIGASGEPDEPGYRARLFLPTGKTVPLDDESTPYRPDDPGTYLRSVSSVDETRFWVANFHEYDIRLLDLDGDTLMRFTEPPSWWQPPKQAAGADVYMDVKNAILDMQVGSAGLLWIVAGIPTPDEHIVDELRTNDELYMSDLVSRQADHVVQVLDRSTGSEMASERFDFLNMVFLDSMYCYAVQPHPESGWEIMVLRYHAQLQRETP